MNELHDDSEEHSRSFLLMHNRDVSKRVSKKSDNVSDNDNCHCAGTANVAMKVTERNLEATSENRLRT